MMGAIQPFLSGAISKTVNMPEAATADEIEQVYLEGWKLGLKAIAIYRDGSKRSQPLSTGKKKDPGVRRTPTGRRSSSCKKQLVAAQAEAAKPHRRRLPVGADRGHPQVRDRGPRGLHHGRALPGRPARRDLPQDGQGRLDGLGPDGLVRDDRVAWRSSTACRCATSSTSSPTSGSSRAASPATRRSRSRSRSWTTSSAGSASRFLSPEDKANLGLIDRSAMVSEVPGGAGRRSPAPRQPELGRPSAPEASAPASPAEPSPRPPRPPRRISPKATAVAAASRGCSLGGECQAVASELTVRRQRQRERHASTPTATAAPIGDHAVARRRRTSPSRSRKTPPAAPNAARSWSATAAATSASTAAPRAAAAKSRPPTQLRPRPLKWRDRSNSMRLGGHATHKHRSGISAA